MGERTLSSAVLTGARVSVKDDRNLPLFSGRSTDFTDFVESLFAHLHGRDIGDFFSLAVHELMTVLTRDTARDKAALHKLGDSGKRGLVQLLDVQAERATPQTPHDAPAAPPASGLGDGGAVISASPGTRSQLILGDHTLDVMTITPDAEAMKNKARKAVLDKLDKQHEVRAIPTEDRVVRITEYVIVSSTIHRILMHQASASVKMANSRLATACGIDLFQILLEKHGMSKRIRTMHNMMVLRKPYAQALTDSDCSNVLDYIDMMLNARLKLDGITDEVFMIHIAEGLKDSDVSGYVTQAMNTNGMTVDDMISGIQDRADISGKPAASLEPANGDKTQLNTKVAYTMSKVQCQLCGEHGHGAMQCRKYPKVKEVIQEHRARAKDEPHNRAAALPVALPAPTLVCGHCSRPGHTEEGCYKLHPELLYCTDCQVTGHLSTYRQCPTNNPTQRVRAKTNYANTLTMVPTRVDLTDDQLKTIAAHISKAAVDRSAATEPPPRYPPQI